MNKVRFWPYGALIVLAIAAVAGVATAFFFMYQRSAQASALPNAARIERVDGEVGINQKSGNQSESQWVPATSNTPVGVGDRIYTKDNARTVIALTGRNFATVEANTAIDVLDLSGQRTQIALREGSALFDIGSLPSGSLFEVATPCGAVDLQQAGIYRIEINSDGNATATAFSGAAQVSGQQGSGQIQKGESLVVPCDGSSASTISKVEPNQAGAYIDNYYRTRHPKRYDGRYRSYYTYLDDPYYYDPERQYQSYNYVNDYIPGVYDLDDYGDWRYMDDYGYVWQPRVYSGWAPYQSGYWTMDYPYGLTWVSSEPWGYAPYHYGRWASVSNQWYWVPENTSSYPTYSPALVAFIPFGDSAAAWVALGPGDPYVNTYYDPYWQPTYAYPSNVVIERVVNLSVPGAVTVVPVQEFTSVIDPGVITHVDPQTITQVRPVLDPLTVAPLRQAAFETRAARGRIDIPRQVEQRIDNTTVVASDLPAPRFRRDLARELRVERLADRARNQKLQLADRRGSAPASEAGQPNIATEQQRSRQMLELARQASRGDRNAREQMKVLRQQQSEQRSLERANVQAQAARVGQPVTAQDQRQLMRQQRREQRSLRRATVQGQAAPVSQPVRAQDQRQVLRQQQQVQREAARQQMLNVRQQRQQQVQAQREQRRQTQIQRAPARTAPQTQVLQPRPERRREIRRPQYQRPAQPRVMAPAQPQVRPQPNRGHERRVAPAAVQPQPVRAQPQPQAARPQPQPQPQAQKQPKPAAPAKAPEQKGGGGKKKP